MASVHATGQGHQPSRFRPLGPRERERDLNTPTPAPAAPSPGPEQPSHMPANRHRRPNAAIDASTGTQRDMHTGRRPGVTHPAQAHLHILPLDSQAEAKLGTAEASFALSQEPLSVPLWPLPPLRILSQTSDNPGAPHELSQPGPPWEPKLPLAPSSTDCQGSVLRTLHSCWGPSGPEGLFGGHRL